MQYEEVHKNWKQKQYAVGDAQRNNLSNITHRDNLVSSTHNRTYVTYVL